MSGDIHVYKLQAKLPTIKSYFFCFTLIQWETKNNS